MRKLAVFFSMLLLFIGMSCTKEYSYEGGVFNIATDTAHVPVIVNEFPICPACIIIQQLNFRSGVLNPVIRFSAGRLILQLLTRIELPLHFLVRHPVRGIRAW